MKTLLLASLLICGTALAASPSSINNDDSCDIKVGPAATLLLPYFEVDVAGNSGQTTLFTITNVTRYPQIAHVTLWTDWAFPVLTFNVFLTGYDVQAINLADVLVRGILAPPSGTTSAATPGALSQSANGNLRATLDCASIPALLPADMITAIRRSLTIGFLSSAGGITPCDFAGGPHANAIGYATIDVVANCTTRLPTDPNYYKSDLLFDNVLIGDYQQLGAVPAGTAQPGAFDAAGNPMVHIRAVPEGGGAGANVATALPYTFYDRYTPSAARTIDRRQPLPSTFAVRYIQGGTAAFATSLTIWREGVNGAGSSCASNVNNGAMAIGELVRFDEHENPFVRFHCLVVACDTSQPELPAASSTSTTSTIYPALAGTDVGGWMYLNLDDGGSDHYSITSHPSEKITIGTTPTQFGRPRASQNWVTATMFGDAGGNRMTAQFDAASLRNGCAAAANRSTAVQGPDPIGPAYGDFVCPPDTTLTNGTTALCTGTNVNPNP